MNLPKKCGHGVRAYRTPGKTGWMIAHGLNREAQRFFSDREGQRIGLVATNQRLRAWIEEIHEYESAIGDR